MLIPWVDDYNQRLLRDLETERYGMDEEYTITDDTDGAPDGHGVRYRFEIDFGGDTRLQLLMNDSDAIQLFMQMEDAGIVSRVREMRAARREWERMSPLERAEALGEDTSEVETGYALDDPKHPTFHERMSGDATGAVERGEAQAVVEQRELNMDGRYEVEGWEGIAFYLLGYKLVRDADYEWTGIEEEDRDWVRAVMVGDDTVHLVETSTLTEIGEDDYCPECGQIGCKAYG